MHSKPVLDKKYYKRFFSGKMSAWPIVLSCIACCIRPFPYCLLSTNAWRPFKIPSKNNISSIKHFFISQRCVHISYEFKLTSPESRSISNIPDAGRHWTYGRVYMSCTTDSANRFLQKPERLSSLHSKMGSMCAVSASKRCPRQGILFCGRVVWHRLDRNTTGFDE